MKKVMICRNCQYYHKNGKNDLCTVLAIGANCERVRSSYEQCGCFEMKSPNGNRKTHMR